MARYKSWFCDVYCVELHTTKFFGFDKNQTNAQESKRAGESECNREKCKESSSRLDRYSPEKFLLKMLAISYLLKCQQFDVNMCIHLFCFFHLHRKILNSFNLCNRNGERKKRMQRNLMKICV